MIDLKIITKNFWDYVVQQNIEIYNEFSLQHELGIFLRSTLVGYKIQFERNVEYFNIDKSHTIKKEIDICIYNVDTNEKYAIELKYPLNGQYPEQMYSFVKDIKFMEQLYDYGFTKTYTMVLVNSQPFYKGNKNDGIYAYFRSDRLLQGEINKPTGKIKESIQLDKVYRINWYDAYIGQKYYLVEIDH